MVADRWNEANKFLNAFAKREYGGIRELIDYLMMEGDLQKSIGNIDKAYAYYCEALENGETDYQKIMPILSICDYYFNGDINKTDSAAFDKITQYLAVAFKEKIEQPLMVGYCILITADLGNFLYKHGAEDNVAEIASYYISAAEFLELAENFSVAATAYQRLALLYESAGDYTNAKKYYDKALNSGTIMPGSALEFELTTSKAGLYEKMKQAAEANEAYRTA